MRLRLLVLAPALAVAGCGGGGGTSGEDTPSIESSSPDYGTLRGGSRIVLTGTGFLFNGAPPNRVLINGREAPLAGAIDDEHLEVIVPEGDSPGDAEIVVFNSNGFGSATGVFRYSSEPAIEGVSPVSVRYDEGATITITGSGFLDEDAGPLTVLIDGAEALDVAVESDTEVTFTAPAGFVLTSPEITVDNHRGDGTLDDAYTYRPGPSGGLLLWPLFSDEIFLVFFDPISLDVVRLPVLDRGGGNFPSWHSVVVDGTGRRIGHRSGQQFQLDELSIDERSNTMIRFMTANLADMTSVANTIYAIDRTTGRFGTFDPGTGTFTPIGTENLGVGGGSSQGSALAADSAGTMYVAFSDTFSTISRTTGVRSGLVALTPAGTHITGMRFVGSTLYAVGRDGNIMTINTTTGATTPVAAIGMNAGAMEFVQ